jgi:hypothetical protein
MWDLLLLIMINSVWLLLRNIIIIDRSSFNWWNIWDWTLIDRIINCSDYLRILIFGGFFNLWLIHARFSKTPLIHEIIVFIFLRVNTLLLDILYDHLLWLLRPLSSIIEHLLVRVYALMLLVVVDHRNAFVSIAVRVLGLYHTTLVITPPTILRVKSSRGRLTTYNSLRCVIRVIILVITLRIWIFTWTSVIEIRLLNLHSWWR